MLLSQFKNNFITQLQTEYPPEEVLSFFNILTGFFLGMSRLQVALAPEKELSQEELKQFENALSRLEEHEPIQYITGVTEFFGLQFKVNKNVLIPRPETEGLVQWILDDIRNNPKSSEIKILDIGTGSGCIAISLAKHLPEAQVWAMDVSPEALETAKVNAAQNIVEVGFIEQDVLNVEQLLEKYDIIVSNPPYVRELEKKEMQRNVLENEPELALYVEDTNPLLFYKKITNLAVNGLREKGSLYFEINQYLSDETAEMLKLKGFSKELRKDIFGNYRMLKGSR
ncbi:peptide chain release factor N(5)-glutamine methyltransferase [Gillisia sp. M10.2A]|uniref:Release factor glutamine methyltransferase n=1 Tax=Gillisia lutea TaxID=2909668 RepID=A0ABS9EHI8_9FLAO|nr:peptide chain release factor N(5)-glutamine methyltransferase [Gillisia lutea]MCF4100923.1 peptide chain release factor N(5)-glutamine methyltransferase [Gillisia lutea]